MYVGSADIRYFWMFSWDDMVKGGGGGDGRLTPSSSFLDVATLFGVMCKTVPVDEAVEEAVEVEELGGKWVSRAHSSPNIASGIRQISVKWVHYHVIL